MTNALFVYGTLMRTSAHPMASRLRRESVYLGPAWILGRLYSLGLYPGATPSAHPAEKVFGDAFRLLNPSRTLAWLDAYEGCGAGQPEPHPYERVMVSATLKSGQEIDAWVYFYTSDRSHARLLTGGRFALREHRPGRPRFMQKFRA